MALTQQIYEHVYHELKTEVAEHLDQGFTWLERTAEIVPFIEISGILFLIELAYYFYESMWLNHQQAVAMILLSGVGCIFASIALICRFRLMRTIQAAASFAANCIIMVSMSGPPWSGL